MDASSSNGRRSGSIEPCAPSNSCCGRCSEGGHMAKWQELLRRTRHITQRSQFDHELHAEMQFHVEMRADELEASGMPRVNALSQARREFGSESRLAEETREAWRFQWLEDFASD